MVNEGNSQDYRQCPVCKRQFSGRSNKRYCSEKCRTIFNQSLRQTSEAPLTDALSILRQNRSLLKRLCPNKTATVKREILEAMGFNPTVFSSIHVSGRHRRYYFCADYGFLPFRQEGLDFALIIRREPYATSMDPWKEMDTTRSSS
ncbi:MAG: hypothetical protein JNL40_02240 [Cyclobacteriaceae bacterium]|nr:hypothetical protein [Cyclobacteriaceae bacterium]